MADTSKLRLGWFDRFMISVAPGYGMRRVRARAAAEFAARHFDAAQASRRTSGWRRSGSDVNAANSPHALAALRELSRNLRRNNGWARRGVEVIENNAIGWGILPKPGGRARNRSASALEMWNEWADSTSCDFNGRLNFYGLQRLVMAAVVESGEAIVLQQPAQTSDGLPFPLRIQVLEADHIDVSKTGKLAGGGQIVDGIELDASGRRAAYWLFQTHPGAARITTYRHESIRVPADRVLHVYRVERPGQMRGVPWLTTAIARANDLDDYEDAELIQQKIAACFGAFVTDLDGAGTPLGAPGTDRAGDPIEELQPGHISYLAPGKSVTFATPPPAQSSEFTTRVLRRIAVSLGVPYEELTGDYSQVNFSSARVARLAHWQNIQVWREHMIIPQLCAGVWRWAMLAAGSVEQWPSMPSAKWAAPPMPILEPDREGLAYQRLVRIGAMTWPQMVRELGEDPVAQLDDIEEFNKEIDRRGIILDVDPRRTTSGGQHQAMPAAPEDEDDGIPIDVDAEEPEGVDDDA